MRCFRLYLLARLLLACLLAVTVNSASATELLDDHANPRAIEELRAGQRTAANAAWWGFDQDDSTAAIQAAINSGAKQVVIPNLGLDWIVRPITLAGDMELVIESGTVISAKRGEYRAGGDCVFTANDVSNLTIRGTGATIKMQKEDYITGIVLKDLGANSWFGPYPKAEWRSVLSLRGCTNVKVFGLTLADSGGDGIYIDDGKDHRPCRNIELLDVTCDNNYRQGISIISVDGLTAERCVFKNTWGTPPCAGVDIEPDRADQVARNILFRNCRFEDNYGSGILIFLAPLEKKSEPVSIRFDDCHVTSRRGSGIRVAKIHDDGPGGSIQFHNCVVDVTEAFGISVQDKSADAARVSFSQCTLRNVARNRGYRDLWAPIIFTVQEAQKVTRFGGIDFTNCHVEDRRDRPVVEATENVTLFEIVGTVTAKNPHGIRTALGDQKIDLAVKASSE